jgi:hypothetical protein
VSGELNAFEAAEKLKAVDRRLTWNQPNRPPITISPAAATTPQGISEIESSNLLRLLVGKIDCRKPNQDVPAFRVRQCGYVFGKFEPPCSDREVISGALLASNRWFSLRPFRASKLRLLRISAISSVVDMS